MSARGTPRPLEALELACLQNRSMTFDRLDLRSPQRSEFLQASVRELLRYSPDWILIGVRHSFNNHKPRASPEGASFVQPVADPPPHFVTLQNEVREQSANTLSRLQRIEDYLAHQLPVLHAVLSPQAMLAECINLVAKGNEPLARFNDDLFVNFLKTISPGCVRTAIIRRAEEIRAKITPQTEYGHYVSLMADGARDAWRIWFGLCLSTAQYLPFWRVMSEPDQRAITIATRLADIVRELRVKGFIVMTIVTDNAANEQCALRPEWLHAVQQQTNVPLFRTPCLSHTINLAIHDFLEKGFPEEIDV
jgi:hypothetical protein